MKYLMKLINSRVLQLTLDVVRHQSTDIRYGISDHLDLLIHRS